MRQRQRQRPVDEAIVRQQNAVPRTWWLFYAALPKRAGCDELEKATWQTRIDFLPLPKERARESEPARVGRLQTRYSHCTVGEALSSIVYAPRHQTDDESFPARRRKRSAAAPDG